jgi:hypothetical protein
VAAVRCEEPGEGSRDAIKRTFEIDVDYRISLVGIDLGHRPHRHQPRIVDQYVEPPELLADPSNYRLYPGLVGHVEDIGRSGIALSPDVADDFVELCPCVALRPPP